MNKKSLISSINRLVGQDVGARFEDVPLSDLARIENFMSRPDVVTRVNKGMVPFGLYLNTRYGRISLDASFQKIDGVHINGSKFSVKDNSLDGIEKMLSGYESVKDNIDELLSSSRSKSNRRRVIRGRKVENFEDMRDKAFEDMLGAGIRYENVMTDLTSLLGGSSLYALDIVQEMAVLGVEEMDIPYFLAYESSFKDLIVSKVTGVETAIDAKEYTFDVVKADKETFVGKLLTRLGQEEGLYDPEFGVLKIGDRTITNLPEVDEHGVFSNGGKPYIPHKIGYFVNGDEPRVERFRVMDPVDMALDAVALQYELTKGDVRFSTVLDVTRNLPDFETHPLGDEIRETLKNKVVINKNYLKTNSLFADYNGKAEDNGLGAVATIMLDDEAKGIIDPLGTSNGANLGVIFYLTKDSTINPDGSITKGESLYSEVGEYMSQFHMDKDNFNRNQMSFNALLTSLDVKTLKVAMAEAGMFNAEDAIVMTKQGAEKFAKTKLVGDKLTDLHGDKGVISQIVDPDMDMDEARTQQLDGLVALAQNDVDLIVSPISMASRLNMGIAHEMLEGEKSDLILPNGEVIKDGISTMTYVSLPQTAEKKSKNYEVDDGGRKYSNLFRYGLSSKIGQKLYTDAFIDLDERRENVKEVIRTFNRLGCGFEKETGNVFKKGNLAPYVESPVTIPASDLQLMTPIAMRELVNLKMVDGQINIDLGDHELKSPLTERPIKDEAGRNVLPLRFGFLETIPYRYNDVFKKLGTGDLSDLQDSFDRAVGSDFNRLTRKDNLIKNVNTMVFKEGARTEVIVPDPRLGLDEVRSQIDGELLMAHRDPVIKSGNTIAVKNIKGGADNVMAMNPLLAPQQDKDYDGDTEGIVALDHLSEDLKQGIFERSNPVEQLNHYGEVYLGIDSGHFKAMSLATGVDTSSITFKNGESNKEVQNRVENLTSQMLSNPNAYGAYALSFTDEKSILESLGRIADDGIKGNREDFERHFKEGYTKQENTDIMKALIAKSEWTGLAGSITNDIISNLSGRAFDPELTRRALDITQTQTQSVLQMKKNADKLPVINDNIKVMKKVFSGKMHPEVARESLKSITEGLIPENAVDKFVDLVNERQKELPGYTEKMGEKFGRGIISHTGFGTEKLAYKTGPQFINGVIDLVEYHEDRKQEAYLQEQARKAAEKTTTEDQVVDLSSLNQESEGIAYGQ